jgi:uncharacterized integral membrane protein
VARPVLWVKRTVLLAVGVALGVATLVFVTLNRELVTLDFYFGQPLAVPLWALAVACLLLGWLIPRLLGVGGWFRHYREKSRLRRRIAELEREVVELRNIPLDLDTSPVADRPPVPTRTVVTQLAGPPARPRLPEVLPERRPELIEAEPIDADADAGSRGDG